MAKAATAQTEQSKSLIFADTAKRAFPGKATRRICVGITKGGAGKTTTSVHLADGLARAGRKVLLVDTDSQGHCKDLLGCNPVYGFYDIVRPEDKKKPDDKRVEFELAVHTDPDRPFLHFLAGDGNLDFLEKEIYKMDVGSDNLVNSVLRKIETDYDYVIIDTRPNTGMVNVNVLTYARELLIPFDVAPLTVRSPTEYMEIYETIAEDQIDRYGEIRLKLKYFLPTKNDRTISSRNALNKLKGFVEGLINSGNEDFAQIKIFDPIPRATAIQDLPEKGKTIFDVAPTSTAGAAYGLMVEGVIGDER